MNENYNNYTNNTMGGGPYNQAMFPGSSDKHYNQNFMHMKNDVLHILHPWVKYGLHEGSKYGMEHAMTEVSAISYLIGKGYNPEMAHMIVESWEKNEKF